MKDETARRSWKEMRSGSDARAVGLRNRAAFEKARATGASTYVREGFRRDDDGVVTLTKTQAEVPTPTDHGGISHDDRPRTGRAPRRAMNARRRGSRRSSSRRSSERSGDSGDDGPSDEPPSRRRLCACCGGEIPAERGPRARYIDDTHAARDRQRKKRERDRARAPKIPATAADRRMFEITDADKARLIELVVCRCNGHHLELEAGSCSKCGHWLPELVPGGHDLLRRFHARLESAEAERRERARACLSGAVVT